jgi:hypothetical protein
LGINQIRITRLCAPHTAAWEHCHQK